MIPRLNHYGAILADPPWPYATYSRKGKGRSAEAHYDCMSLDEIRALPVGEWAARDCVLFLWITNPRMEAAFDVVRAWGFEFKTLGFSWIKTTKDGAGYRMMLGHWTRANTELCLLATRGNPHRQSASVRQLIAAPPRKHSQKPDEIHDRIEALVPGPYLELFARAVRSGWDSWGNEVETGPAERRWASDSYPEESEVLSTNVYSSIGV